VGAPRARGKWLHLPRVEAHRLSLLQLDEGEAVLLHAGIGGPAYDELLQFGGILRHLLSIRETGEPDPAGGLDRALFHGRLHGKRPGRGVPEPP
jgi:hypothetical protein